MNEICRSVRKDILNVSKVSNHGHIPSCFSIVEILHAVFGTINHFPDSPSHPDRDYFILSKGHACLALYCTLGRLGYYPIKEVETYGAYGSKFGCHPDRTKIPGVEASTGSLGHGISLAVGHALASKIRKDKKKIIVLIGDGESNEGTVWEAVMVAASQKLDNLTIIYDGNKSQGRCLQIKKPEECFRAFGCEVHQVDGHDVDLIKEFLNKESVTTKVLIANTTKGFGCQTLVDNKFEWHRRSPNDSEMEILMKELENA